MYAKFKFEVLNNSRLNLDIEIDVFRHNLTQIKNKAWTDNAVSRFYDYFMDQIQKQPWKLTEWKKKKTLCKQGWNKY